MKQYITFILLIISCISFAQTTLPNINKALRNFGFIQEQIIEGKDTVTYYLRNYKEKPQNLVVFIQGTDANPIFSYSLKNNKTKYSRLFGDDFKNLDSTYTYAIIPKPDMEGVFDENDIKVPEGYYEKNHLDFRIKQLDLSIKHIIKNHLSHSEKVIVYGHSEGAVIGAALASINSYITHLGFWSGNVLNNFYEFSLFNRIDALQKTQSDSLAHHNIMRIVDWYKSVIENPNSTEIDHFGFTNKRWFSYEKAPIDYLLAVDIPIYAVFGSKDESTPIETAYLLPIQFLAKRKTNLTFEVCIKCNHSYTENKNGVQVTHWNRIFNEFVDWTNENN